MTTRQSTAATISNCRTSSSAVTVPKPELDEERDRVGQLHDPDHHADAAEKRAQHESPIEAGRNGEGDRSDGRHRRDHDAQHDDVGEKRAPWREPRCASSR